jgi:hypothetical protein
MGGRHICGVQSTPRARLDVLVQSKRNKHAALKLMRKLLKKYAFVPERLVTDDLRSYGAAARALGIGHLHERGRWRNNRVENSTTRAQDATFQALALRRNFSQPTPPLTTSSTSNAISYQSIALRASRRGVDYVARGCCGRLKFAHESRFASSFHNVTAPDRVQAVGFGAAAPRVTKMLVGSTTLLITPCAVRGPRPATSTRPRSTVRVDLT